MFQKKFSWGEKIPWRFIVIESILGFLYFIITFSLRGGYAFPLISETVAYTIRQSAGLAFLLLGALGGVAYLRTHYSREKFFRWMESFGIAAFIVYICFLCQHFWGQDMPSSGDHVTHYVLATLTEYNLRFFHSLTGWCSAISTGIPLNEQYPPGGNMVVCLMRGLTIGFVPRETVYMFCVMTAYFGFAFLLYDVVRRNFGRLAAVLFLVLLGCDGGLTFFGLQHSLEGGMWASQLGAGLSIWAFARSMENDFPQKRREGVLLALAVGCSMVLHSFSFFLNVLWIGLALIYSLFIQSKENRILNPIWTTRKIVFLLLGFGVSAFYLLPFLLSGQWVAPYGDWGTMMPETGREILQGLYFRNSPMFYIMFGLPAMVAALFSKRPFVFVLSLFCLVNFFAGADLCRLFFNVETARDFFIHMQVARLVSISRVASMILISGGIGILCQWLWRSAAGESRFLYLLDLFTTKIKSGWLAVLWKNMVTIVFLFGLIIFSFPYLYTGYHTGVSFWQLKLRYLLDTTSASPKRPLLWLDMLQAFDRIPQKDTMGDPSRFFIEPIPPVKMGVLMGPWYPMIAAVTNNLPTYASGYMPAVILKTRLYGIDNWKLNITNVKYLLDTTASPSPEIKNVTDLIPVYRNQSISLYESRGWNGKGWVLHGQGNVDRIPTQDNSLQFNLQNIQPNSVLRIGVSRYRKWKAFLNEKPVEMVHAPLSGEPAEAEFLMGIPVENGTLKIVYRDEWFDRLAVWITLLSLLGIAFLLHQASWRFLFYCEIPFTLPAKLILDLAITGGVGVVLILALCSPGEFKKDVVYLIGSYGDQVGGDNYKPDGKVDICLGLEFSIQAKHGKVSQIVLNLIEPDGSINQNYSWRTGVGPQWKIGVLDALGNRCEQEDGTLVFPDTPRQKLILFIKPLDIPKPSTTYSFKCIIHYTDGTIQEF